MTRPPPVVWLLALALPAGAAPRAPCEGRGTSVVVRTAARELHLCEAGRTFASYAVSLGRGGTGKRRRGDLRTPLGTYPLGEPRASKRFHTFVPIGYPTPEQRRAGLTGSDVGLHGPDRRAAWLGRLNTWADWTQGCVATARDDGIDAVAAFVRTRRVREVHLE